MEKRKTRGWRYLLMETIRSKDMFSHEGLFLKPKSTMFGALITITAHLLAFIIFV